MNRRTFLQIAGGMVVGAIVSGNGPNPVIIPNRPRVTPTPYRMPSQMAHEMGKSMVDGFAEGIKQGFSAPRGGEWHHLSLVIDGDVRRVYVDGNERIYWPTSIEPTSTAEYDQEWEEI